MKKLFRSILLVLTTLALFLGGQVGGAAAATTSQTAGSNGFRISPVRTDLVINPGSSQIVTVYITNVTTVDNNLQVLVNDFQARDETGTPALLLNGQSAPKHGLKQYTTVPTSTINLKPGQQAAVNVKISIPSNAVAGGYYGAVRFAPVDVAGNKNVNLAASVGSLILVKVPGDIHEQVSLIGFGANRDGGDSTKSLFDTNKGLKAIVRFQNNGDVQEEPFGKIQLKKGGTILSSYEINTASPPGNVLPGSIRLFSVNLTKVGSFGKYTLEGNFGYGSNGQLLSATSTFYVIPLGLIAIVIVIILLIIGGFILIPRGVRRHDRRILRKARRQ